MRRFSDDPNRLISVQPLLLSLSYVPRYGALQ